MKPIPKHLPAPWAATATAPLLESPVSEVRERLTEPVSMALRRPVLPFQVSTPEPAVEASARRAVVLLAAREPETKPEPKPETKPALEAVPHPTRRNWPLAGAVASVVLMLFVTAVQVAVEVQSRSAAAAAAEEDRRLLPTARLAAPMPPSELVADVPSAAPAPPLLARPAVSSAPVRSRAPAPLPIPRPRSKRRGDVVDPWGE